VRGRAARILGLGSDAVVGLPVEADEVRALLKKYGVKVVMSGHHHLSTRYQEVDGIIHIVHAQYERAAPGRCGDGR
jgi:predicted phosphodiesterase